MIELQGIGRTYRRPTGETVRALDAVSLRIDRGRMFPVRAQQMRREVLRDEAHLPRRRARTIDDQ